MHNVFVMCLKKTKKTEQCLTNVPAKKLWDFFNITVYSFRNFCFKKLFLEFL